MSALSRLSVVRPLNLVALWGAAEAGARLAGGPALAPASLAPALAAAFGYARNDAIDAAVDRANRPDRPIPSGRLTARSAHAVAWVCLALGAVLTLSQGLGAPHLALYAIAALSLYFYSPWLKNRGPVGPAVVALLSGLAVLWGGWIGPGLARSLAAAGLASAVSFARECAKDLEDVAGDAPAGKGTWPVQAGEGPPRLALRVASAAGLILIPIPWLLGYAGAWYLGPSLGIAAPILVWCVVLPPRDAADARRTTRALKVALLAGVVGLWLGATPA
ncbi:MAG TPA: UbiA family prenyltransferase [Candidatus Eisenbacteria bacterium]